MPIPDVTNMKVADLKRELKIRGLSTTGNKTELQERLQTVMEVEPLLEESGISGEELLDEDAVLTDEEDAKILNEHELLKSPLHTPSMAELIKDGNNDNHDLKDDGLIDDELLESPSKIIANVITSKKKIVLKRKISQTSASSTTSDPNNKSLTASLKTTKENAEPPLVDVGKKLKMSDRNPIKLENSDQQNIAKNVDSKNIKKLSELSVQERLEMRAKKFGIEISTQNSDPKSVVPAGSLTTTINDTKQIEILKKRAERFGCVTSTNLAKIDAQERLLKRKQRFGDNASLKKSDETSQIASSDDWAEKARKRLERFKTEPGNSTKNSNSTAVATN